MSWLSRIFKPTKTTAFADISPDTPFYVIGDTHGCDLLLEKLLGQLDPDVTRVYVGDYVDRGDQSANVMRRVMADQNAIHLVGNHEAMMLGFIDAPAQKGPRWLRYGGLQTLASFGVSGVTETSPNDALGEARDALVAAMGTDMVAWMRGLQASYKNGNVAVVHAGANPSEPLNMQSPKTFMWGHGDFEKTVRSDGIWVVHGHTIVDQPYAKSGRIAVDTGAYATGRLTAAHVTTDGVNFIST